MSKGNSSENKEWKIGPMTPCTLKYAFSKKWDKGPSLRFCFINEDGAELFDGMWWMDDMTPTYFENIVQRTRHIVNTIAGRDGFARAGDPQKLGLDAFFKNLANICNEHKGEKFYIKTLYKLGADGSKRVRLGLTVSFIARPDSGKILSYSTDEQEDTRLKLI
jgi:hypothetical protein